jgi:peroxiredoxin
MTHPLVAALEDAFQEVRDRDLTLGERLKFIADCVRTKGPGFAKAVDTFVGRLEAAQAGSTAPKVGDIMPDFCLPDHEGQLVKLQFLLENGPVVIAFHRGHWCPYCRLNMVGLAEIQDDVGPAQIVAISSEIQQYTCALRAEAGARFPFLTDVGGGYALSINLAILVDEAMSAMIGGAGWDVPGYQGGTPWVLPIPAVFVVRQDGIIATRHVDPDYRRRMELDALLDAVKLVCA